MRLARTLSIQTGRKLNDKSREDIVKAVSSIFKPLAVVAIQLGHEVVRVTFGNDEDFKRAMEIEGVRLFGLYCRILGGGPPITIVNLFDYPFEEEDSFVHDLFKDFGDVKGVKKQTYLFDKSIYTGTRLVSLVLKGSPLVLLQSTVTCVGFGIRVNPLSAICVGCKATNHRPAPTVTSVGGADSRGTLPVPVPERLKIWVRMSLGPLLLWLGPPVRVPLPLRLVRIMAHFHLWPRLLPVALTFLRLVCLKGIILRPPLLRRLV